MHFLFWYLNFWDEKKYTEYIIEMRDAAYVLQDAGQSSQFRDCPAKCGTGGHPSVYICVHNVECVLITVSMSNSTLCVLSICMCTGADWDNISGREISHSSRPSPFHTPRGVASGGKRVTECIGPRGLGGPRSPTGHREHRDILFE